MRQIHNATRRAVVSALASLPLAGATAACGQVARQEPERSRLVAYFSRSGNTRVIAGLIQRSVDADLFEIQPASAYPADYLATVEQARQERDSGFEPPLASGVAGIAKYDTIYLGFPIWGTTTPPVIRSFLRQHDLSGKTLVPFVTHGGYGLGNAREILASHAPGARIEPPFSMEADQERRTMDAVNAWLGSS
ncbi:flavodoxin [Luteimonas fraxinea]|uniref:Flavodoxin n=1 Tax=Luteimonas fraxinea TaxID=2901869 RepID=A0ABS8UAC9_9GAMM|nr:flavodoxin [Luteimonas fraxinea]MCD9096450.1 flavodoxin [Luteimonas fraxinea]UHH10108.1 flavodoxin [Luteimonas fraxinea]